MLEETNCGKCYGTGYIPLNASNTPGEDKIVGRRDCPHCHKTGRVIKATKVIKGDDKGPTLFERMSANEKK